MRAYHWIDDTCHTGSVDGVICAYSGIGCPVNHLHNLSHNLATVRRWIEDHDAELTREDQFNITIHTTLQPLT